MNIKIRDQIGPRCIIREDGQKIYELIHKPLLNNQKITLDFEGVAQFASPFFNFAIGQLLKDISKHNIDLYLKIENISETGQQVIDRVIENAVQYHNNSTYKNVVDDIIKQQEEESE